MTTFDPDDVMPINPAAMNALPGVSTVSRNSVLIAKTKKAIEYAKRGSIRSNTRPQIMLLKAATTQPSPRAAADEVSVRPWSR